MAHHGPDAAVDFPVDGPTETLPIHGHNGDAPKPTFPVNSRKDRVALFAKARESFQVRIIEDPPHGYHLKMTEAADSDVIILGFDGRTWYKRTVPAAQANYGGNCLISECLIDPGIRLSLEALTT